MGTPFSDIFEYFSVVVEDYRLDNIYRKDEEAFYTVLKKILLTGLPEFDCLKSLAYTSQNETQDDGEIVTRYYFVETLDSLEVMIISKIMAGVWFRRKVNDVRALEPYMSQKEFKKESVNENLKQKKEYLKELIVDYMGDIRNYYSRNRDTLEGWGDDA
jgi:hypothetical protein